MSWMRGYRSVAEELLSISAAAPTENGLRSVTGVLGEAGAGTERRSTVR